MILDLIWSLRFVNPAHYVFSIHSEHLFVTQMLLINSQINFSCIGTETTYDKYNYF